VEPRDATTLLGEGLQHQDGQSPLLFSAVPTCAIYDPAYAYELAVIIQDASGACIRRWRTVSITFALQRKLCAAAHAGHRAWRVAGVARGHSEGIYKYRSSENGPAVRSYFGSGSILI